MSTRIIEMPDTGITATDKPSTRGTSVPVLAEDARSKGSVMSPAIAGTRLQPILSSLEVWGFGFTGLLLWLSTAPGVHNAMQGSAILMWIPITVIAMIINFQVRRMATHWPEMSGGTPNYTARLVKDYPLLGRYAAIAYFQGWAAVPAISAIMLADVIGSNLTALGIEPPMTLMRIGFTLVGFVVAFAGTRALSVLHLFFVVPAIGFLLLFCVQGLGWLALSPASPGLLPASAVSLTANFSFSAWAAWFFVATYSVYGVETSSSFVVDSRHPGSVLKCLKVAALLMPVVFIGGSWIITRLVSNSGEIADNVYLNLLNAALPFWGSATYPLVSFLIAAVALLTCATGCANSPRVMYQLARDGQAAPVFGIVSRRSVPGPALVLTLMIALAYLTWGDMTRVLMVSGTGYFFTFLVMHFGQWLNRGKPYVLWPWLSLGFFIVEAIIFIAGGLAWNKLDFLIGLLFPLAIMALNMLMRRVPVKFFQADWWINLYRARPYGKMQDGLALQVAMLIFFVCGAATIGWGVNSLVTGTQVGAEQSNLFVILLMVIGFLGVAAACWSTLPQVASVSEAREQAVVEAHHLLTSALDAILIVSEKGIIRVANPAVAALFGNPASLAGRSLRELFPGLSVTGNHGRSEHVLTKADGSQRNVEVAISKISGTGMSEYAIILHDITERKRYENQLAAKAGELQQKNQDLEKSSAALQQAKEVAERSNSKLAELNDELIKKKEENDTFLYSVTHDLRSPLVNLQGFSQELLAVSGDMRKLFNEPECPPQIQKRGLMLLDEDMKGSINFIQAGVMRLSNIMDALLRLSRAGRVEYQLQRVDLNPIAQRIIDSMNSIITQKGARVTAASLPAPWGDPTALEQVFANLVGNALNYLNPERPGVIEIGCLAEHKNGMPVCYVKDNGLGMSEQARSKLFRVFQRFHPGQAKGEGIGLALVKRMVERHEGQIWAESVEGEGATFFVALPTKAPV